MRFREIVLILLFAGVCVASSNVAAQCAGFTDVTSGDQLCNSVVWLKNRQITLGCTATTYCPLDPVGRLQMAAFMNRLGELIPPRVQSVEASGGMLDLTTESILCVTASFSARTYTRALRVSAALSYEVTGFQDVQFAIVRSLNGGAWVIQADSFPRAAAGERSQTILRIAPPQSPSTAPSATDTYRVGLRVIKGPVFSGNAISSWACHLEAAESMSPFPP